MPPANAVMGVMGHVWVACALSSWVLGNLASLFHAIKDLLPGFHRVEDVNGVWFFHPDHHFEQGSPICLGGPMYNVGGMGFGPRGSRISS